MKPFCSREQILALGIDFLKFFPSILTFVADCEIKTELHENRKMLKEMLFLFLAFGSCLTFFNVPVDGDNPYGTSTFSCATITLRAQWNNFDYSRIEKNYTLFRESSNGCAPPPGRLDLMILTRSSPTTDCNRQMLQRIAQDQGYGAAMERSFGSDYYLLYIYGLVPLPYVNGIPYVTGQSDNYAPQLTYTQCSNVAASYARSVNITAYLDGPLDTSPGNLTYENNNGQLYVIRWTGFVLALVLMVLASFKLGALISASGLHLSVPVLVLTCCWWTGVFVIFNTMTCFGIMSGAPLEAVRFFLTWEFTFALSALLLLGMYFRDVATLTSSSSSGGLTVMKIPCIILVCLIWATQIVQSFLTVFPVGIQSQGGNFAQFSFAVVCLVCAFVTFCFFLWYHLVNPLACIFHDENGSSVFNSQLLGFCFVDRHNSHVLFPCFLCR